MSFHGHHKSLVVLMGSFAFEVPQFIHVDDLLYHPLIYPATLYSSQAQYKWILKEWIFFPKNKFIENFVGTWTPSMPSECAKICDLCLNYVLSNIVTLCSAGAHFHELILVGEQLRGTTYNLLTTYLICKDKVDTLHSLHWNSWLVYQMKPNDNNHVITKGSQITTTTLYQ